MFSEHPSFDGKSGWLVEGGIVCLNSDDFGVENFIDFEVLGGADWQGTPGGLPREWTVAALAGVPSVAADRCTPWATEKPATSCSKLSR